MALVLVLVFTGLLLIVGSAVLSFTLNEKQISVYQSEDIRQYYLAEAGIEAALTLLNQNSLHRDQLERTLGDGSFSVTFEELSENSLCLISTGKLENSSITIEVIVEIDQDYTITVTEWRKP
ncbi:MAG: hypothetical protein SCJ94_02315 [Bacillota bacterium]|nr:hypothetical protein [Bacillota bacterium]